MLVKHRIELHFRCTYMPFLLISPFSVDARALCTCPGSSSDEHMPLRPPATLCLHSAFGEYFSRQITRRLNILTLVYSLNASSHCYAKGLRRVMSSASITALGRFFRFRVPSEVSVDGRSRSHMWRTAKTCAKTKSKCDLLLERFEWPRNYN